MKGVFTKTKIVRYAAFICVFHFFNANAQNKDDCPDFKVGKGTKSNSDKFSFFKTALKAFNSAEQAVKFNGFASVTSYTGNYLIPTHEKVVRREGLVAEGDSLYDVECLHFFYALAYERAIGKKTSLQITTIYGGITSTQKYITLLNSDEYAFQGTLKSRKLILIPELRYYFREAMRRFYVQPYVAIGFNKVNFNDLESIPNEPKCDYKERYTTFYPGFLTGYQLLLKNNLLLDFYFGLQMQPHAHANRKYSDPSVVEGRFDERFMHLSEVYYKHISMVGLRGGVKLGYKF